MILEYEFETCIRKPHSLSSIPIHLVAMRTHVQPVLCAKIVNLLHEVGAWLSPGNMVFSTDITYLHDISEILLKAMLTIIII